MVVFTPMQRITDAANTVAEKLKGGFEYKETHYQKLLAFYLQENDFIVSTEENITYSINDGKYDIVIGYGRLDIKLIDTVTEKHFIIELKVADSLKYLKSYRAQLKRYLRHYSKESTDGALIVFGQLTKPLLYIEEHNSKSL